MSLINDALKRASTQAQSQPAPAPTPQATPVATVQVRDKSLIPLVLAVFLVGSLFAAGAFFWKWASATQQPVVVATQQPVAASEPRVDVSKVQPPQPAVAAPVTAATPVAAPEVKTASTAVPVAAPDSAVSAPAAALVPETKAAEQASVAEVSSPAETKPVVPTFPDLKLQGIFYTPSNPSAVINRRTFYVGGVIAGARITKIEQESVTVEWNGETRVLELTQ